MFIVNSYQFDAAAPAALLLDLYPSTAAYSLRKLRSAYSGSAIRVRRSSDNAELDIGFVGNYLDTASMLTFVGAGNGFVTTWYDQQGSNNLTQGTSANQPQIVASGVTILRGGNPAVKFDGSNDRIGNFVSPIININDVSYFSVTNNDLSPNALGTIHSQHNLTFRSIRTFNSTRNSGAKLHLRVTNSTIDYDADLSNFRPNTDVRLLSSFIDSTKNMSAFDNGATGGTNTYGSEVGIGNNGLQLGTQSSGVTFLNGTIQEFIAYNTDESANRTAIETDINTHYAIY